MRFKPRTHRLRGWITDFPSQVPRRLLEYLELTRQKYNEAKSTGLHHNVSPPLQSFASELVGLFLRIARVAKQFDSRKIRLSELDSFHRILPPHVIAASNIAQL